MKKLRKGMVYKFDYQKSALKDLDRMDPSIREKIFAKLDYFLTLKKPLSKAKKLKGDLSDCYRFRIGDYRVIFKVQEDGSIVILLILKVAHRKESY